jgi:alpha-tubulin suppressor-like RCC1 family protein
MSGWLKPIIRRSFKWQSQKRSKKVMAVSAFILVLFAGIFVINYQNTAKANWNGLITWSTQSDFETNTTSDGSNGTTPAPTTSTFIDTTSSPGDMKLVKPNDIGNTMAGGYNNSLIVKNDGTLWVTGENIFGQLGLGDMINRDTFEQVTSMGTDNSSVAANYRNSFVIKANGDLWGAGINASGELGLGDTNMRKTWTNTGLTNVKQVVNGQSHSLALKNDGTVWVTGDNTNKQLGSSAAFGTGVSSWTQLTSTLVSGFPNNGITYIAAGLGSSYLVQSDARVWTTGLNTGGQLGRGNTTAATDWVKNTTLANVSKVFSYNATAFIINTSGVLYGTGAGSNYQLGNGSTNTVNTWTSLTVTGSGTVVSVACGYNFTIVLKSTGLIYVTGVGSVGQLGNGIYNSPQTWTLSSSVSGISNIATGAYHTMIRDSGGLIKISGASDYGQTGAGGYSYYQTISSLGIGNVVIGEGKIASGSTQQLIIVSDGTADGDPTDGTVWVSGGNGYGQLGLGDYNNRYAFTQTTITDAVKVVASGDTSMALKSDGTLWATGRNFYGCFGIGTGGGSLGSNVYYNNWTQANSDVKDISLLMGSSLKHGISSMVVKNDGTVWSAGYNGFSQLGLYPFVSNPNTWIQTAIGSDENSHVTNAINVTSGGGLNSEYFLVITATGQLYATGRSLVGGLGLGGATTSGLNGMALSTDANATDIVKAWGGYNGSSFMKKSDGTIWVVGANTNGELGLGDITNRTTWESLSAVDSTFDNAISISSTIKGTMIIKSDGTLWATGSNIYGEQGVGNLSDYKSRTFRQVSSGFSSVSSGLDKTTTTNYLPSSTILTKSDGSTYVTGSNLYGSLGIVSNNLVYDGVPCLAFFTNSQANVKKPEAPYSHGEISGFKVNAGDGNLRKWMSLGFYASSFQNYTSQGQPYNRISFMVKTAATESELDSIAFGADDPIYASISSSDNYFYIGDLTAKSQWIEIKVIIEAEYGANTPVLSNFSLDYSNDITPPSNPTSASLNYNGLDMPLDGRYYNFTTSTGEWFNYIDLQVNGGPTDGIDGSGIEGCYLYYGQDETADPLTEPYYGGLLTPCNDSSIITTIYPIAAEGTYYFRIRSVDLAGNMSDPVTIGSYILDMTPPTAPSLGWVSPFGWSSQNKFSFSWNSSFDEVGQNQSGVAGYQYKLGGDPSDWSGSVVVSQDPNLSDSNEVVSTNSLSVANLKAYQNGENEFFVRAVDNAGNYSIVKTIKFFYNGSAPSAPILPSDPVTPQSSNINSFTFKWGLPTTYNGSIKGYRYSINAQPNTNNTSFINLNSLPPEATYDSNTGIVTLSNIPAATIQGFNKLYVVAVDINDQVAYSPENIATIDFSCETAAPGKPTTVQAFDTSNRSAQEYSVALKWLEPADKGVGFAGYNIERSTDGINFSLIGSSTSNSFINTSTESTPLISTLYYYRILSKDNSNNLSAPSDIVSITPTGRYTTPPEITVAPKTTAKVSTASVYWVTDRGGSSFVEIGDTEIGVGCSEIYGLINGKIDFVTEHTVTLTNLKPDSIYHYRVKFIDEDGNIGCSTDSTFKTQPAPRVENVAIQDVRLYSALLTWYTSEPATSDLLYGKSTNYANSISNVSGGQTTIHSIYLTGLEDSSTYHFAVRIKDVDGNEITSDDYSFETQKFPKISNIRYQPLSDQATAAFQVSWDTNVPTTTVVQFKPDGGVTQEAVKTKLETKHSIIINGLFDNTYYLMNTVGADQFGYTATSPQERIKTSYDTRPPVINNIATEVSNTEFGAAAKSQIVISWQTDEPSTSQVEYDFGVTGDSYGSKTQEDTTLTTSHVVVLTGLRPSSSYHLRAVSKDASGNKGVSDQQSVLTEQARSSVLDVILNSLQSSLGWIFGVK